MIEPASTTELKADLDRVEREVREAIREFVAVARYRHAARLMLLAMVEDATRT